MKNKVLIVDDAELNREILKEILKDEYDVVEAEGGQQAIEVLEEQHDEFCVVLLDLIMPEVDGFAVLEVMKENRWIERTPVLIISVESAVETETMCFDYGISDFIRKPFDHTLVRKRVDNVVKLFQYQNELEETVERQTATLRKQYHLLQTQAEKIHRRNESIIDILGTVVEYRNLESGEHIKRVKGFTEILAREAMKCFPEYGLTEELIDAIVATSSLHDIGKIVISDSILLKPGKLTAEEFATMKSHTTRGSEILMNIQDIWGDEYQKVGYEICRYHHERYDGKGYPDRLKGEEIPVSAQLVSIADVYDALVSERVYKKAYPKDEAFRMIMEGECGVFSPKLLECFEHTKAEMEALADSYS